MTQSNHSYNGSNDAKPTQGYDRTQRDLLFPCHFQTPDPWSNHGDKPSIRKNVPNAIHVEGCRWIDACGVFSHVPISIHRFALEYREYYCRSGVKANEPHSGVYHVLDHLIVKKTQVEKADAQLGESKSELINKRRYKSSLESGYDVFVWDRRNIPNMMA